MNEASHDYHLKTDDVPHIIGTLAEQDDDDTIASYDAMSAEEREQFVSPAMELAVQEALRRRRAAAKDSSMLGESGYDRINADFYPTPPENVDCLLQFMDPLGDLVWEPACGNGAISKRLMALGHETWSSDLHDQGFGTPGRDFLAATDVPNPNVRSIITNPPYAQTEDHPKGLAEAFVRHALLLMKPVRGQVAMFLRNEFDCGKGRMDLFTLPPFHQKIVVTKRPRWIEGSDGSPRHSYSWFVWDWRHIKGPASIHYAHPSTARRK